MIPIHLVCDQSIYCAAQRLILERDGRVRVASVSYSLADTLRGVAAMEEGVALVDATMPELADLDAIAELRRAAPGVAVLLLYYAAGARYLRGALAVGAAGCVRKDAPPEEILLAIESVSRGHSFVSAPIETDDAPSSVSAETTPSACNPASR